MNRRLFGAFGVLTIVAFTAGGCKSDPLSDLDGTPARVVTNFSYLQIPLGGTATVNASVLDARTTPLEVPITFTPCTADVSVAADPGYNPIPATSAQVIVTANAPAPTCLRVAGGGIEDTVTINVLPGAFNGGSSSATPIVGQTFSLYGSALLGFDVGSADIDFGDGISGEIIRRVGDTLTVRVPQPDASGPAPLNVLGIAVKYVPGLVVDLPTATNFTVTPAFGRASGGPAAFTVPADGDSVEFYDGFTSDLTDYWYPFTVASPDTLVFTVSWDGAADLDAAICNGVFSGCTGGFGGATVANPETWTVIFAAAGNYNIMIEQFDTHDEPAHIFKVKVKNP
jgi:hypothetical protein